MYLFLIFFHPATPDPETFEPDQSGLTVGKPGSFGITFKSNPVPEAIVWVLPDATISLINNTEPVVRSLEGEILYSGRYVA